MAKKKAVASESKPEGEAPAAAVAPAAYVVFARRFRPQSFAEVAGQQAITHALQQALSSGRLAQAYLFCGPRGVGKTSLARIFAKAINCQSGQGPGGAATEPCNACDACRSVQEGRALDVIEMDAATNRGIEEVRALRENVGLSPAELRYKVYIIDEVHMLTREAWNAFLKTLEEPPAHVKFIFATTDPNNVPETILSRCQRYDLRRIGPADIVKRLRQICEHEKVGYEEAALSRIANVVRGGLRDAEGMLDQAVNLGNGKVTDASVKELSGAAPDELILDILKGCAAGKTGDVLAQAHSALEAGADPEDMLNALVERLRGTLLSKVCGSETALLEGQSHLKEPYAALGALLNEDQILMLIQLFTAARRQLKDAAQTRLPLEMALIRAARAAELVDMGKLVSALEAGGISRSPPGPAARSEGPRPNSSGRPADAAKSPAAAEPARSPAPSGAGALLRAASHPAVNLRERLIAAVRTQKGGALLGSALNYAAVLEMDDASSQLMLGYAPEQKFYVDTLSKPDPQNVLKAALAALFGRDVSVKIERLSADDAAAARARNSGQTVPAGLLPPRPAAAPVQELRDEPDEIAGETEVDFDDAEALPLRAAAPPAPDDEAAAPVVDDEEPDTGHAIRRPPAVSPLKPGVRAAASAPASMAAPVPLAALKEVTAHPLVQMVLKETGGVVLNVTREAGKNRPPDSSKNGAE